MWCVLGLVLAVSCFPPGMDWLAANESEYRSQPQQIIPEKPEQERANQDHTASPQPIVVNVLPAPKSDEERAHDEQERVEKALLDRRLVDLTGDLATYTERLFWATVFLAIGTAGLVAFGFFQSADTKESLRISAKLADSTMIQANILKMAAAANITIQTPKMELLKSASGPLQGVRLYLLFQNTGQSSTVGMRTLIAAARISGEEEFEYDFPAGSDETNPTMVGRNSTINTGVIDIARDDVVPIIKGDIRLFLYGWVEYDDVFPDTPRHRLEYCFLVRLEGDPFAFQCAAHFDTHGPHNRYYDIPRQSPPTG